MWYLRASKASFPGRKSFTRVINSEGPYGLGCVRAHRQPEPALLQHHTHQRATTYTNVPQHTLHPNAAMLLHCILSGVCLQSRACLPSKATLTANLPFISSSSSSLRCISLLFTPSPHLGVFLPPYPWAWQRLTDSREMSVSVLA